MDEKILLDTSTCIDILKGLRKDILEFIEDKETFITTITIFELLNRERNFDIAERFVNRLNILNFDESSARLSSEIFKDLKKRGMLIDYRDIFIASICIINNCDLITLNLKDFRKIKDLKLIKI